MISKLVGCQLIDFNENGFTVINRYGYTRSFVFIEDEGDCCGYNILKNELLISDEELKRNPVITKVEAIDVAMDDRYDCNNVAITFFGEAKKLAIVNSLSSSGSGWTYGASVTLKCVQTGEEELITSW